ncbi:hypothetical protein [Streptomyces syringium]
MVVAQRVGDADGVVVGVEWHQVGVLPVTSSGQSMMRVTALAPPSFA